MKASLFLVRHGVALPESRDPLRPLSEAGQKEIERVGKFLSSHLPEIDEILHSNKLRARQTAEILGHYFNPAHGLRETGGLHPTDDPSVWLDELNTLKVNLMLVGHLPFMARLSSLLTTGKPNSVSIAFYPGTVAALGTSGNDWSIEWVFSSAFVS